MDKVVVMNGPANPVLAKLEGKSAVVGVEDVEKSWAFMCSIYAHDSSSLTFEATRPAVLDLVAAERGIGFLRVTVQPFVNTRPNDWRLVEGGGMTEVFSGISINLPFQADGRIPPTALTLPIPANASGKHQIIISVSPDSNAHVTLAGHFTD